MTNFGITREMFLTFMIRLTVLLTAIPVHECAHGLAADRLGDDTPRKQGRLTLNPFEHLEWMGSVLILFAGFGWGKPVQVDMRNFKRPRRDMALTSLAGPVSNIIMALILIIIYKFLLAWMISRQMYVRAETVSGILGSIISINISLAVFNILPVPPLDGSKIFGALLSAKIYWGMLRYQRQISMVFMVLVIFGVFSFPIWWISQRVVYALDWMTSPLDGLINILWKS